MTNSDAKKFKSRRGYDVSVKDFVNEHLHPYDDPHSHEATRELRDAMARLLEILMDNGSLKKADVHTIVSGYDYE